jgi:hypothetical protein
MAEEGFWASVWGKISTIRQGVGVLGQLCALGAVVFIVLGVAIRSISSDLNVSIPILIIVAVVALLFRDFFVRSLQFAKDRPQFASIGGQQTVALMKLGQASRDNAIPQIPSANVEPMAIESEPESKKLEGPRPTAEKS